MSIEIDILSLVVGGILWELLNAYIHFVAKPGIRRLKARRGGYAVNGPQSTDGSNNKKTTIGFAAKSKEES